jgi:chorismate-pyruvate lyase
MAKLNNTGAVLDCGNAHVIYADSLVAIDEVGPNSHLIFAMTERNIGSGLETHRLVVARVIIPTAELVCMAKQLEAGAQVLDGAYDADLIRIVN